MQNPYSKIEKMTVFLEEKNNVKYQTMINEVLDQYAQRYNEIGSNSR